MNKTGPTVLMILDGWGYSEEKDHNAIAQASTPHWDAWWKTYPHTLLDASGDAVGLPKNQMGNSEVGHMHIGAGRRLPQDLTRINEAIASGDFEKNARFTDTFHHLSQHHKALHVMGLLSSGGVHSHEDHLLSFLACCQHNDIPAVYLHLFLDGRDTPPRSALKSIQRLEEKLKTYPGAVIASITGRYYAMDRDKRWKRTAPAFELLTTGQAEHTFDNPTDAINNFYATNTTDEFIPPTRIGAAHPIQDGDAVFFFNFRADRARQLTEAFINPNFKSFQRKHLPKLSALITMTDYGEHLSTQIAFPQLEIQNTLGEVIAAHGLRQLRLAETEKYAHVTFFLNGGREDTFQQEDRQLIPSPQVATYDLQPEMHASLVTDALVKAIQSQSYDVIICNYANADMVGHTGNLNATIQAIETLDDAMGTVWDALSPLNGQLLITADHGNAECLFDPNTQQAHTAHTHHLVPFLYVGHTPKVCQFDQGSLIDIAPTVLELLGITPPEDMTGHVLLGDNDAA